MKEKSVSLLIEFANFKLQVSSGVVLFIVFSILLAYCFRRYFIYLSERQ